MLCQYDKALRLSATPAVLSLDKRCKENRPQ